MVRGYRGDMSEPERDDAPADRGKSFGNIDDAHWSRARREANPEALAYLRERSHRPGVAEGGGARNMYCPACQGVIPIAYDSRVPPTGERERCPHCGHELDPRVREMFNWVEIDQVSGSDAKALLLPLLAGILVLALTAWLVVRFWT